MNEAEGFWDELLEVKDERLKCAYLLNASNLIDGLELLLQHDAQFADIKNTISGIRFSFESLGIQLDKNMNWRAILKCNKPREISKYPLRAYLSYAADEYELPFRYVRALQSYVLLVAFHCNEMHADSRKRIETAYMQIRMMFEKDNASFGLVPTLDLSFKEWVSALKVNTKSNTRYSPVNLVLSDYLHGPKTKRQRKPLARSSILDEEDSFVNLTAINQKNRVISDEDDEASLINSYEFGFLAKDENVDSVERLADQIQTKRLYDIKLVASREFKTSQMRQSMRSRQIANRLIKRSRMLLTDTTILTRHEIQCCLDSVYCNDDSIEAGVVAIMLLTGLQLDSVLALNLRENKHKRSSYLRKEHHGNYCLIKNLDLPAHKIEGLDECHFRRSNNRLEIQLPGGLSNTIRKIIRVKPSMVDDIHDRVINYISTKAKNNQIKLTSSRISKYFSFWLNRNQYDSAIIELLSGNSEVRHASVYYSQMKECDLQEICNKYICRLVIESKCDLIDRDSWLGEGFRKIFPENENFIGTQLSIDRSLIHKLFARLNALLDKAILETGQYSDETHNAFTIYTLMLLNLSTGHRPVNDPFDSISKFNLDLSTILIADKDTRSSTAGAGLSGITSRILILPKIGLDQTKNYLDYFQRCKDRFQYSYSDLATEYKRSIFGESPFLFFRHEGERVAISVKETSERLCKIWRIPLNWHRHFLRTEMMKLKQSAQDIDAWMGHAEFGNEAFSKFCGMSLSSLKKLADDINYVLVDDLKIDAKTVSQDD